MDVNPLLFPSLLRTAEMKNEYGRGDFSYRVRGDSESPTAMFLYAERFSQGLRNRMGFANQRGLRGRFPDSPLEKRLYI